jgi:MOSC domain-containing protein YiiM
MIFGRVASLHIHPVRAGGPMVRLPEIQVEAEKGIVQDSRYFGRRSSSGKPTQRQITLVAREEIAKHAADLGENGFAPGVVRSNIETEGLTLAPLAGKTLEIGAARILVGAPRDPCEKMDAIKPGLRSLMDHGRQGVLGQIVRSGTIREGDAIRIVSDA